MADKPVYSNAEQAHVKGLVAALFAYGAAAVASLVKDQMDKQNRQAR